MEVKALFFDVFGTLMDWRNSVAAEAERVLAPKGHKLEWHAFAEAWRGQYHPSMEEVRSGRRPFVRLDVLHRENLARILPDFGIAALDDATMDELNLAWHRLNAWPDTTPGLLRLRKRYLIAPCSNGNILLMAHLARHNGFAWDAILGSEIAHDYKPKPRVYLAACEAFGVPPREAMMCAAHSRDLAAASALGLRTAHIARPNELGPGRGEAAPTVPVDIAVGSVEELAQRLDA